MSKTALVRLIAGLTVVWLVAPTLAQDVCLPAPRLLTTMPMGGQTGTTFEVTVTGQNIDGARELLFSDPRITAKPKEGDAAKPEVTTFVVTVAAATAKVTLASCWLTRRRSWVTVRRVFQKWNNPRRMA